MPTLVNNTQRIIVIPNTTKVHVISGQRGPVGPAGPASPDGGDEGQVLTKLSNDDQDTGWRAAVPLGVVVDFYGATAPDLYLTCDGSLFDEEIYPALFFHLGSNVLPDLRDKSTVGASPTHSLGTTYGASTSSVPQHQHADSLQAPAHTHPFGTLAASGAAHTHLPANYGTGTETFLVNLTTSSGIDAWIPFANGAASPPAALNGVYSWMAVAYGSAAQNADPAITMSGSTGAATATALTGSVGNVSGATVAGAESNYHPVMAVLKCIKATN